MAQSLWSLLLLLEASSTYFYVMHRLLHHPGLYSRFHRQHHELETPVWQGTLYCSLVEHIVVNAGSLCVPLWFFPVSAPVFVLFVVLATFNAFGAHHAPWGQTHALHHLQRTVNYGAGTYFWDRLLGTYAGG
jgi:sterol desaturase/sphingolipid hydroxylase (fatty acid hydroxylase superfamily)